MTDWPTELKPSMRKLRQAMDGLLKTARLTHSVFRVQEDKRSAERSCNVRYRRHVCFSQAVMKKKIKTTVINLQINFYLILLVDCSCQWFNGKTMVPKT